MFDLHGILTVLLTQRIQFQILHTQNVRIQRSDMLMCVDVHYHILSIFPQRSFERLSLESGKWCYLGVHTLFRCCKL